MINLKISVPCICSLLILFSSSLTNFLYNPSKYNPTFLIASIWSTFSVERVFSHMTKRFAGIVLREHKEVDEGEHAPEKIGEMERLRSH